MLELIGDAELPPIEENAVKPFVGVTVDGRPQPGLFALEDEGFDVSTAVDAANAYLRALPADREADACRPIDSSDWRLWSNAFLTFPEHGLRLAELSSQQREAALEIIRTTLSADGFRQVRGAMRLNDELGQFLGLYSDTLTEWCYWFTLFGAPDAAEPWGWQLQGHHVNVHCFVLGRQVVVTPTFLGAEFHGQELFAEQRARALEFMGSLTQKQRAKAVLYPSMDPQDLPRQLAGNVNGRHRAAAGQDNLVLPYEGLRVETLTAGQCELLMAVLRPYLAVSPEGHAAAWQARVETHLSDTWFSWIGGTSDAEPFYYKVHGPAVLVEYDNHPGVFLDNDKPEPFHVHTIVRTPNGGDYGKDLLAQHYARHH